MKNPISKIDALLDRLTPTRRDGVKGLLIAVALVALALIVRLAIAPVEAGMPFLTFFPAVTLAAVLGGFRASSFAMLACSVLASYLFFAPFQSFPMAFHADLVWANIVFYIEEMLVIVVVESMYHQRARYYTSAALFQELEAAKQEQKIAAVAFESQEGIMITDAKGIILRVNQACADLTGYSVEELVGQTPRLLKSGRHDADFYRALWQKVKETGGWQGEIWDRRKDGVLYLKWLSITAVKNELGVVTHYVSTQNDISDRIAAENKIQHLAFYDPLTQLPNRRLLIDRILQAMAISARSGKKGALLFIDLDHFKKINDTLGHGAGDLLLQQAAARLSDCVSEIDTVARMGATSLWFCWKI